MRKLFSKGRIAALAIAMAAPWITEGSGVPVKFTVETSRADVQEVICYHGEQLDFEVSFKSYGQDLELDTVRDAKMFWQTNGMAAYFWQTNNVTVISNKMISTFMPSMDVGAGTIFGFIGIPEQIYRASFVLRFKNSPGAKPEEVEWPFKALDFAHIQVMNPPYYTKTETDRLVDQKIPEWAKTNAPPIWEEVDPTIPAWAKTNAPPIWEEVDPTVPAWAKTNAPPIWEEVDPTVPAWAKQPNPPPAVEEVDPIFSEWVRTNEPPVLVETDPTVPAWAKEPNPPPAGEEVDPIFSEWAKTNVVEAQSYVLIGENATAPTNNVEGNYAISIGNYATVNGKNGGNNQGVAIGRGAYVGIKTNEQGSVIGRLIGDAAIAIGSKAKAYGQRGVSIGYRTENYGISAVAIGSAEPTQPDGDPWHVTIASNDYTIAIGHNAQALAKNSAQIGWGTNTTENTLQFRNTRIVDTTGKLAETDPTVPAWAKEPNPPPPGEEVDPKLTALTNDIGIAIGRASTINGKISTLAIGYQAAVSNTDAFAFGSYAVVGVMNGTNIAAGASGAMQLGSGLNTEPRSLQFRTTKIVNGSGRIPTASLEASTQIAAIGNKANKSDLNDYYKKTETYKKFAGKTIIGPNGDTGKGADSISIGTDVTEANGVASIAIGPYAKAKAVQSIVIGGRNSEGRYAVATAQGAVQIGPGTNTVANTLNFGASDGSWNTQIINAEGKLNVDLTSTSNYVDSVAQYKITNVALPSITLKTKEMFVAQIGYMAGLELILSDWEEDPKTVKDYIIRIKNTTGVTDKPVTLKDGSGNIITPEQFEGDDMMIPAGRIAYLSITRFKDNDGNKIALAVKNLVAE